MGLVKMIRLSDVTVNFPLKGSFDGNENSSSAGVAGGAIIENSNNGFSVRALRDVSLEIAEGDIVGILGANGSGKSTLLRLIAGVFDPDDGEVEVSGRVCAILDITAGLEPDASGKENVVSMCLAHGATKKFAVSLQQTVKDFSGLGPFMSLPVCCYSSGMVVRLAVSILLHLEHDVLLLDEWMFVADEEFNKKVQQKILANIARSRCVVMTSQSKDHLSKFCHRIYRMKCGVLSLESDHILESGSRPVLA
jgi:lipopolysaccharide transport system ATP-binding protein